MILKEVVHAYRFFMNVDSIQIEVRQPGCVIELDLLKRLETFCRYDLKASSFHSTRALNAFLFHCLLFFRLHNTCQKLMLNPALLASVTQPAWEARRRHGWISIPLASTLRGNLWALQSMNTINILTVFIHLKNRQSLILDIWPFLNGNLKQK